MNHIHLWLGEENEKSILMYMVGEGEIYITSSKTTNQIMKLILSDQEDKVQLFLFKLMAG